MKGRIVLVASYPKSGNTWIRAVLEQLRRGPEWTFSINKMPAGFYGFTRRVLFDSISPVNAADLFFDEIENNMPDIYRTMIAEDPSTQIIKVHDDLHRTPNGEWLYPPDAIYSVIYAVRHPYDVAVSFANHMNLPVEEAVRLMQDGDVASHVTDELPLPLPQHVGSWTSNIASWIDNPPHSVTLVRYEDMYERPVEEFSRLADVAGFTVSREEVSRAVGGADFDKLRSEEQTSGFRERPPTSENFFRAGRPRSWTEEKLNKGLRDRIAQDHAPMMERLGYLADGTTVSLPGHKGTL